MVWGLVFSVWGLGVHGSGFRISCMTVRKECDASACGSSENLGAVHARVEEAGDKVVFFVRKDMMMLHVITQKCHSHNIVLACWLS